MAKGDYFDSETSSPVLAELSCSLVETYSLLPTFRESFEIDDLKVAKAQTSVSVCVPAKDEQNTIATIIEQISGLRSLGLVDEIIVVDDRSTDNTAAVAQKAGAQIIHTLDLIDKPNGKGDALWCSLQASEGDIICWCDADVTNFSTSFITQLLGPLLHDPETCFVKGFFERPYLDQPGQGGRTTELMARPILSRFFPSLTQFWQPLGGEYAGRREILEEMSFASGYGVDIGLLIDICDRAGLDRMAQVDLGSREHRNRSLDELGPQAMEVLEAVLQRAGVSPMRETSTLYYPGRAHDVAVGQQPPVASFQRSR